MLLLHGFGDTPQTFCYLIPALHDAGFTVRAPLLPGHGRTLADFDRSTADQWLDAARKELTELRRSHVAVGVGGLSMGGTLTVLLAAESQVEAVVLVAPYVAMPPVTVAAAVLHRIWGPMAGPIRAASDRTILDAEERKKNLGYGDLTARVLNQLWLLVRRANRALPRVTAPTLIIQSRDDNRISPRTARRAFRRIAAVRKKLVFTTGGGHIVTVDRGREAVIDEVREWLLTHLGRPAVRIESRPPR